MSWIKVEDRLPNFYIDVFLYTEDENKFIGYAVEEEGEFLGFKSDANDLYYIQGVTHWHKLIHPDFPKDK